MQIDFIQRFGFGRVPDSTFQDILVDTCAITEAGVCMPGGVRRISGDEIFLNHTSKESILRSMPDSSLDELQKTYQLTHNELHFVQWFVTLPSKEREMFLSSLNCISALSHLYPPGAS